MCKARGTHTQCGWTLDDFRLEFKVSHDGFDWNGTTLDVGSFDNYFKVSFPKGTKSLWQNHHHQSTRHWHSTTATTANKLPTKGLNIVLLLFQPLVTDLKSGGITARALLLVNKVHHRQIREHKHTETNRRRLITINNVTLFRLWVVTESGFATNYLVLESIASIAMTIAVEMLIPSKWKSNTLWKAK